MDREQEDMQFLGLLGIYLESYKIIFNFRRIFSKITLAFILPLSLILLTTIWVSEFHLSKINDMVYNRHGFRKGTYRYAELSASLSSEWAALWLVNFVYLTFFLVFAILSSSAVVYTVASVFTGTGRHVTFGKLMRVVPKVSKRFMVTFLCVFLAIVLYNVVLVPTILWSVTIKHVNIAGLVFFIAIVILYVVGLVYMTVVWQLAGVVSVLEDIKGIKAMNKSKNLIQGKMWIAIIIWFKLNFAVFGIQILFKSQVVHKGTFGVAGRFAFGFLCLLMLFSVLLFALIIETVIYFVCKSYHREYINKLSLSDHIDEAYVGEYIPIMAKDDQLENFDVRYSTFCFCVRDKPICGS
ncbi:uncharacterized protein LOC131307020 [Rhododendron vialii]|uniref:uncharacterized protein LOC131307020 n=1 Tax=Rhododendron vialii TaxID=182163 RepID=UPI00265FE38E|nr:uncharacterized protein LOC131307020 [Rhododendron vialii]